MLSDNFIQLLWKLEVKLHSIIFYLAFILILITECIYTFFYMQVNTYDMFLNTSNLKSENLALFCFKYNSSNLIIFAIRILHNINN